MMASSMIVYNESHKPMKEEMCTCTLLFQSHLLPVTLLDGSKFVSDSALLSLWKLSPSRLDVRERVEGATLGDGSSKSSGEHG
jgi:hypothetical protein